MLEEIQCATDKVFIWSDEMFTVQAVMNSQNDRVYAADAGEWRPS